MEKENGFILILVALNHSEGNHYQRLCSELFSCEKSKFKLVCNPVQLRGIRNVPYIFVGNYWRQDTKNLEEIKSVLDSNGGLQLGNNILLKNKKGD